MSWLSIGSEDLSNRPEVKAGDRVHLIGDNLICTVQSPIWSHIQIGVSGEDVFIVGIGGRLKDGWGLVQ